MATVAAARNIGRVVQVIGPVLDVEFESENLPELYNALELIVREQLKQAEQLDGLFRELAREDEQEVSKKLHDADPLTRWLAVQVAGKKRMAVEQDLVDLLADPHPAVRGAAQQALVKLARGTDLGPPPSSTPSALAQAQRRWRDWLDLQAVTLLEERSRSER